MVQYKRHEKLCTGRDNTVEQNKTLVTAGIVAYGGAEEVAQAAISVAEHTQGVDLRLMILDNASPDGAGNQLQKMQFSSFIIPVLSCYLNFFTFFVEFCRFVLYCQLLPCMLH